MFMADSGIQRPKTDQAVFQAIPNALESASKKPAGKPFRIPRLRNSIVFQISANQYR